MRKLELGKEAISEGSTPSATEDRRPYDCAVNEATPVIENDTENCCLRAEDDRIRTPPTKTDAQSVVNYRRICDCAVNEVAPVIDNDTEDLQLKSPRRLNKEYSPP